MAKYLGQHGSFSGKAKRTYEPLEVPGGSRLGQQMRRFNASYTMSWNSGQRGRTVNSDDQFDDTAPHRAIRQSLGELRPATAICPETTIAIREDARARIRSPTLAR